MPEAAQVEKDAVLSIKKVLSLRARVSKIKKLLKAAGITEKRHRKLSFELEEKQAILEAYKNLENG